MRKLKGFIVLLVLITGCRQRRTDAPVFANKDINAVITGMTDIMIHDVTNPPLAARFYAYACLAGYEVVAQHNAQFKSMHGVLMITPICASRTVSATIIISLVRYWPCWKQHHKCNLRAAACALMNNAYWIPVKSRVTRKR